MIAFFWAVLSVVFCGIRPDNTALRMFDFALKTWVWLVSGPGPLLLPLLWQKAWLQKVCIRGFTSMEKVFAVVPQLIVLPPVSERLLLQEIKRDNETISDNIK